MVGFRTLVEIADGFSLFVCLMRNFLPDWKKTLPSYGWILTFWGFLDAMGVRLGRIFGSWGVFDVGLVLKICCVTNCVRDAANCDWGDF